MDDFQKTLTRREAESIFTRGNRPQWLILGLALMLLISALDYASGFTLRFTVLYLMPVLIFTWVMGRLFGIVLSVVAVACWAYIDVNGGRYVTAPQLLYWEWGGVLVGYVALVTGFAMLRRALETAQFQSRKDGLTGLVNKGGF